MGKRMFSHVVACVGPQGLRSSWDHPNSPCSCCFWVCRLHSETPGGGPVRSSLGAALSPGGGSGRQAGRAPQLPPYNQKLPGLSSFCWLLPGWVSWDWEELVACSLATWLSEEEAASKTEIMRWHQLEEPNPGAACWAQWGGLRSQ